MLPIKVNCHDVPHSINSQVISHSELNRGSRGDNVISVKAKERDTYRTYQLVVLFYKERKNAIGDVDIQT